MEYYYKLIDMMEKEIKEIVQKGQLSAGDIDVADKATHTIKSVECILEKRMRSSSSSYDYSGAQRRDTMGRYMDAGPSNGSYGRVSMDGGYSGRMYSRDEGRSHMMSQLENLMQNASSPEEREVMQQAMSRLQNLKDHG